VIRILVVDDNDVVRSGVCALLATVPGLTVVAEAATGRDAIAKAEEQAPDIVLLDVRMPVLDGVSAARVLSEHAAVLMLTYSDEPEIIADALRNGAQGYLVHGTFTRDELVRAIRDVAADRPAIAASAMPGLLAALRADGAPSAALGLRAGDHPLSTREAQVMDLISTGRTNGEIAAELYLAEKTVKNAVNRIYTKLGVSTRAEAIARWVGTSGQD
jgi:DNA-binding NarL/FixJ family response regulator